VHSVILCDPLYDYSNFVVIFDFDAIMFYMLNPYIFLIVIMLLRTLLMSYEDMSLMIICCLALL